MTIITPRIPSPQLVRNQRLSEANRQVVVSPVGGWNTRDPLSAMQPTDAIILDNWLPGTGSVFTRPGYSEHTTGFDSNVETIMAFDDGANQAQFAASGTKIYSWSTTSGGTGTEAVTGLSNARWQHVNFNANLICVNGADTPRYYNNASGWQTTNITGGSTPANFNGINVFKNRIYYWDTTSQSFWYSNAVNTFQGTFDEFPLNRVSQTGGSIVAMGNITNDGGDGSDDLACFIMSTGEVIIYDGDNPGNASSWALIGRYRIPRPINSPRCVVRYGGDLRVQTEADIISVQETIRLNGFNQNPSKITGAQEDAADLYKSNFGWASIAYPASNLLIYNVPISTNSKYHQYVQNVVTGAYCRFTNINARCFGEVQGKLYIGGNQKIHLFDGGALTDDGSDIVATGQPAYTAFNIPNDKRFINARLVYNSAADLNVSFGVGVDYEDPAIAQASSSSSTGAAWEDTNWDDQFWADEKQPQRISFLINRQGVAVSPIQQLAVSGAKVDWYRTDYDFEVL